MALTQISTAGVKDDAVTAGKIPANAVGSSELADNAVDTAAIADDAVTSAKIADATIVNANINASAAIAGTKIAPDFGTQQISSGNITVSSNAPNISFVDGNDNPDYKISANSGALIFEDTTNSANRLIIQSGGTVDVQGNLDANSGLDVTGAITGTGDLTIDTNTLHVDSSNNRVGIGTTSPLSGCKLTVAGNGLAITGQNTAHSANSLRIGQEGSGLAQFRAYGPDTSTAGSFQFTTSKSNGLAGASNAMRIDSSGNVGIGTTSPHADLHIQGDGTNAEVNIWGGSLGRSKFNLKATDTGSAGTFQVTTESTVPSAPELVTVTNAGNVLIGTTDATTVGTVNKNLVVGSTTNNDEVGLTLNVMEGTNGRRVKFFLDDNDGVFGVDSTASTGLAPFVVRMGTTERMRILAGGGLTFNGDTAAANALDDYEEGTHTPADASSQITFNDATGHYTKIGRQVIFEGSVTWPSTGGQYGVGITLPFAGSSNGRTAGGGFTRYTNKSESQTSHVNASSSNFTLYTYGGQQIKNADMSNKRFDFVIVYSTGH